MRRPEHGFTLIEVLVALGIVAVALLAGLQATCCEVGEALGLRYFRLAPWVEWSDASRSGALLVADGLGDGGA